MCNWGTDDVAVQLPAHVCQGRERRTASIDRCIVEPIKALWAEGIDTLGCCCGHGDLPPNVVLADTETRLATAVNTLYHADPEEREWSVLQWRLTTVATVRPYSEETPE